MSGAQMFVVYADGNNNVTVSPRLGRGHVMPSYNSNAQISVLEGSRVQSDGSLIANIRCDSCLSWSGGSMSATDSSSSWIWAYTGGSALDSTDADATIQQHDQQGSFTLDLTQGTGGSSVNPFIQVADSNSPSASASASGSATGSNPSASASASASGTNPNTAPIASSNPSSESNDGASRVVGDNTIGLRRAHGFVMSITFVLVLPLAALTLYLPFAKRVLFIHAPLQTIGVILMVVGLATGVVLGNRVSELDAYHQIIGYIVVAVLILFQPILGILQHLYFRRHGGRSMKGVAHQWLGRSFILLGVVNGGLGFNITGPVGSRYVPRSLVIAYAVVAGIVGLIYIAVVLFAGRRNGGSGTSSPRGEKRNLRDWETEMQPQSTPPQQQQYWEPQGQAHGAAPKQAQRYTIENRNQ